MKPGRELDLLVAEKVMGLKIESGQAVESYSTDKSAAMNVVDKIDGDRESHASYTFHQLYDGFDLKEVKPHQPMEEMRIDPYEICIAALKAVGHAE